MKTKYAKKYKCGTIDMKKKLPKYQYGNYGDNAPQRQSGSNFSNYAQLGQMAYPIAQSVNSATTDDEGRQNPWVAAGTGALTGAAAGAVAGPWGAAIGGVVGGGVGYAKAYFGNKKADKAEAEQKAKEDEYKAEMEKQKAEYERQSRLNYSRAYLSANPTYGTAGVGLYKMGGSFKYKGDNKGYGFETVAGLPTLAGGKHWIQDAVNPAHKGYCTPMTKETCTPRRKALAMTFKKHNGFQKEFGGNLKAIGGELEDLSSNVQKVEGDTHNQDTNSDGMKGVTLFTGKKPIAEVEGGETIVNNKSVGSDRILLPNGKSVAEEIEKVGKQLGKEEAKAQKSTSLIEKQTSKRNIEKLNMELQQLLTYQENYKTSLGLNDDGTTKMKLGGKLPKYGNGTEDNLPYYLEPIIQNKLGDTIEQKDINFDSDYNTMGKGNTFNRTSRIPLATDPFENRDEEAVKESLKKQLEEEAEEKDYRKKQFANKLYDTGSTMIPYLDNWYANKLLKETPKIPTPVVYEPAYASAMPLKTKYNVQPALNTASDKFRELQKNLDTNIADTTRSAGNKLAAFSSLLKNQSELYNRKENVETELKNKDILNKQAVQNINAQTRQQIDNMNKAEQKAYNYAKMQRLLDINELKQKNVSNIVEDFNKRTQDKNEETLDNEKILTDILQYTDAEGVSQLIGSPTMDRVLEVPGAYDKIKYKLKDRPDDLRKFEKRYSNKKNK